MKKLLALFLAFSMIFSSVTALAEIDIDIAIDTRTVTDAVYTWNGGVDTSWYDASQTEFVITSAEQFAGLAELVDGGETFEESTIILGGSIDLTSKLFDPIGSYRNDTAFKGTFDGNGCTISNLSQNTWELNNGYYYGDLGLGLFGLVEDATIKNLTIDGASISGESAICGAVAATAYGNCVFENITIANAEVADYQYYAGGVVGWASGDHKYLNCDIAASTTITAQWGDFDNSTGGVIGGCGGSATIYMKDCDVSCRLDVYNDVTSSYQWYAYRRCGMLIGNSGKTETTDGRTSATAPQLTAENCTVTYGDWTNYTYCEFAGTSWPYVRVEAGISNSAYSNPRYGHPTDANGNEVINENHKHNDGEDHNILCKFNQLYGGGQGVYGGPTHEGVTIYYSTPVAKVAGSDYHTLQEAIDLAAVTGEAVEFLKDTKDTATVKAPAIATFDLTVPSGVTIDLNGFTLTGAIVVEDGATANLINGAIVNEDDTISAIETKGTTTIENVNITSPRHGVRVEGGVTTINSGNFSIVGSGKTQHAVNVSDGGKVIINGGTFEGPAGTTADSGSAVCVQAGSEVEIYGGTFTGGKNATLSTKEGAVLKVFGGLFDQDPSDYVVTGYDAVVDTYGMFKVVKAADADEIVSIVFEKADKDASGIDNAEGEDLYNINVVADAAYADVLINRLNSVDLTFDFDTTAVTGGSMDYEIVEVDNISVTPSPNEGEEHRYMFSFDTKDSVTDTANSITIGQVKITGYGKYSFVVDANATTNEVHATTQQDNVVDTFIPGGAALGLGDLDISDDTITDVTIAVPTRELTIQIAFPNALEVTDPENSIDYQDMQVEISGNIDGVQKTVVYKLGDGSSTTEYEVVNMTNGGYSFVVKDKLVLNNTYNVTVSGAGYRTARYTVTMTEDKTLNFWNNVKDNDTIIEVGKESSKTKITFLAGDIVKDNNINIYDLSAVVSYFGTTGLSATNHPEYAKYDLNRDGKIDSKDVAYVLVSWNN